MKDQKLPPLTDFSILYLSFFGVGFAKYAPGTMGSLATIPILLVLIKLGVPSIIFVPIMVLAIFGTCLLTDIMQRKYKFHDPGWIVIDEVLGMATTWIIFPTSNILGVFVLFGLFRLFDIKKIWPATYFDRMEHGMGTILDDIVSAVFAGLCLHGINYFYPLL